MLKLSVLSQNHTLNALAARLNGGWLDIFAGDPPEQPDAEPTGDLLASLRFQSTAFKAAADGVVNAHSLTSDPNARHDGEARWYRLYEADHRTVVLDGTVGLKDADLVLNCVRIQEHAEIAVSKFSLGHRR